MLGQPDFYLQKNEVVPLSHTVCKNEHRMDQRPKERHKSIKFLEENTHVLLCECGLGNAFLDMSSKGQEKKKK